MRVLQKVGGAEPETVANFVKHVGTREECLEKATAKPRENLSVTTWDTHDQMLRHREQ